MRKCPESLLPEPNLSATLREDLGTFAYHYVRLFREISRDVKRGLRKPKAGKRYVAGLSAHQSDFLVQLKTRNFK